MTLIKDTSSEHQQIEFRVIPHGWGIKRISEFTSIITGGTPNTLCTEYWGGDIRWMNSGELNLKFIDDVKGRITTEGLKNSSTHLLPEGCVLIGLAGQGKTRGTAAFNRVSLCTNQSIAAILPSESYDSLYLYYVVDSKYEYLRLLSSGEGGRGGLNKNLLSSLFVLLPNDKNEQKAIAQALNDVDKLIIAFDKKIEKKCLMKQGVMQQLLTGKIRLPGYIECWKEKKLGENSTMNSGGTPLSSNQDYYNGSIPFLSIGDISVVEKYIDKTEKTITEKGLNNSSARMFHSGTVMYAMYASLGKCAIANIDLACSQAILGIVPNHLINNEYLYYYLTFIEEKVKYWGQTGTQTNLSKQLVQEFMLKLSPDVEEQIAIASILSDIDKEIADLEAKRDKYKLIKKGMMQKLLTGQIRLVKSQTQQKSLAEVRRIPVAAHIIAGHIVNSLYGSKGWGRTKLQKSMHLVGYCCQLDFGNEYIQNTAGPDDQILMNHIDTKFRQYRHVKIVKQKDSKGKCHYDYRPNEGRIEEVEVAFENYPIEIQDKINELLAKIKSMDLSRAEIISTLYAVWNNRIIKNEPIADELLLEDFYGWSKHKLDFSRELVLGGLNYMRKEGIIPTGWGKYIDKKE